MKHLFFLLLICSASFANAQVVNIPDPAFKAFLVTDPSVNTNGDNEIQVSEAINVTSLSVFVSSVTDLTGIQSFTNLQTFSCLSAAITSLDLSGLVHLISLTANDNQYLTSINVTGCDSLKYLSADNNSSTDISVNFGNIRKIEELSFDDSYISVLDLRAFDSLANLSLGGATTYIGSLNISGLTKLESLNMFGKIGTLIARGCTGLKTLHSNDGTAGVGELLDVTGCINLETIYLYESNLTILDLSSCINLQSLFIYIDSPGLEYLNVKNGSFATISLGLFGGPQIPLFNICADDFEIAYITGVLSQNFSFNISSYCDFFPGGNYNTIKGQIKLDLNNNGCDVADAGMSAVPIRITDTSGNVIIRYTAPSGDYAHYPYKGVFTLAPYFPYPYFTISPAVATVTFDTANSLVNTTDFCISPNGAYNDLEISLLPTWQTARPGLDATYVLSYKNRGTTTLSGSVQLNYDNSKMNFAFAGASPSSQSPGQLTWNYNNLLPFASNNFLADFTLLPSPVNNIGDTLLYFATINPIAGDETMDDNSFILPQRVNASFDPNDKQCTEGSKIDIAAIGKDLHYIIHFQNLGTDTAFNVVVADTLSNNLDWNTFEFIGSSYPCDVKLVNGRLEFWFRDIRLPYAAINEAASHGYVAFSIKPKSTVTIGDSLKNRAAIYFDSNPPVVTNTVTTIVSPTNPLPVKLEYFSVSKKDETNLLTWKAPSTTGSTIFNIERSGDGIHFNKIGNITATAERSQLPFNFTDAIPLNGRNYYRLKITDADGGSFYSKILIIGNNKSGLDIIAITSDHNNVKVYFDSDKEQTIQLKIIAGDGKTVYTDTRSLTTGSGSIILPLKNVATGIYTLLAYTKDGEVITKRFIK